MKLLPLFEQTDSGTQAKILKKMCDYMFRTFNPHTIIFHPASFLPMSTYMKKVEVELYFSAIVKDDDPLYSLNQIFGVNCFYATRRFNQANFKEMVFHNSSIKNMFGYAKFRYEEEGAYYVVSKDGTSDSLNLQKLLNLMWQPITKDEWDS